MARRASAATAGATLSACACSTIPSRFRPWRYVFELQPRHARKIVIDNAHYVSPGQFEDRSASYTPFVRAALARLAIENPKARALIGETPKRYFFLLLLALLALGGLAFALVAVRTPVDALPYALTDQVRARFGHAAGVLARGDQGGAARRRARWRFPRAPCHRVAEP